MSDCLTIALAQINPVVGDSAGNLDRLRAVHCRAAEAKADLVLCPELCVTGYPPEDLVLRSVFVREAAEAVETLARETRAEGPTLLVGAPLLEGGKLYNAMFLLASGAITAVVRKHDLPNYGPFDEKRTFSAGPLPEPVSFRGVRLGLMICEDMWTSAVAQNLARGGADILLVPNGSPFEQDKQDIRLRRARARVVETGLPLAYVNQIGGQDELAFDGASFVLDRRGEIVAQAAAWREDFLLTSWHKTAEGWEPKRGLVQDVPDGPAALYQAMTLALRDYVAKNKFPGVVLGLSGGVDSALAAAIAVDALGTEKVWAVMMPSPYTARQSLDDAVELARRLGCRLDTVPIEPAMQAFGAILAQPFVGRAADTTEENIQSRCRGLILMALSNKFGPMVLATGNKSEMAVGYATLYGDMCGGYAVLKDLYKTTLYDVARWRNAQVPAGGLGPAGQVIPESILTRAPTAELKPDQTDQDSLPPYEILDDILRGLIEGQLSVAEVAARGHDEAMVRKIWTLLKRAEYKRRQSAPGVKLTARSFGRDWRYPLTDGRG